jgi:hypothetical protein
MKRTALLRASPKVRLRSQARGPVPFPLDEPRPGDAKTAVEALHQAAEHARSRDILYLQADGGETAQTCAELLAAARRVAAGLREAGLAAGDRAVLQLADHEDVLAAFWGCALAGIVPVVAAVPPQLRPAQPAAGAPSPRLGRARAAHGGVYARAARGSCSTAWRGWQAARPAWRRSRISGGTSRMPKSTPACPTTPCSSRSPPAARARRSACRSRTATSSRGRGEPTCSAATRPATWR